MTDQPGVSLLTHDVTSSPWSFVVDSSRPLCPLTPSLSAVECHACTSHTRTTFSSGTYQANNNILSWLHKRLRNLQKVGGARSGRFGPNRAEPGRAGPGRAWPTSHMLLLLGLIRLPRHAVSALGGKLQPMTCLCTCSSNILHPSPQPTPPPLLFPPLPPTTQLGSASFLGTRGQRVHGSVHVLCN